MRSLYVWQTCDACGRHFKSDVPDGYCSDLCEEYSAEVSERSAPMAEPEPQRVPVTAEDFTSNRRAA